MNKTNFLIVCAIALLSIPSAAIEFMGPPTATLQQGQFRPDFTSSYSENEVDWEDVEADGINLDELDLDDLDINRYYSTTAYGINDRWEAYGRAGAGEVEDSDADFAYGWGTRVTVIDGDNIDWGVGVLMSWLEADDIDAGFVCISRQRHPGEADLDFYELQVAAGPTIKLGILDLYGGVLYYMLEGDYDATVTGPTLASPVKLSGDLEEDANIGGYTGAILHLNDDISFMIETAVIGGSWGVGGNIGWSF